MSPSCQECRSLTGVFVLGRACMKVYKHLRFVACNRLLRAICIFASCA